VRGPDPVAADAGPTPSGCQTAPMPDPALPADERPVDPTPVHTGDLPDTPVRDRNIPARAWVEAPQSLLALGDDIGRPLIAYKRRLARRGDARYLAVRADDLDRSFTFRLYPDGTGTGVGPSGATHQRFRTWKEDLRDHD
jgi:hypothetical protein